MILAISSAVTWVGGCYPSPSHNTSTSTGPMSFLGRGCSHVHPIILPLVPGPFLGYPLSGTGWGYPLTIQDSMGIPSLGWIGYPLCLGLDGTWTGYAVDSSPLAVSCRRTFLFGLNCSMVSHAHSVGEPFVFHQSNLEQHTFCPQTSKIFSKTWNTQCFPCSP